MTPPKALAKLRSAIVSLALCSAGIVTYAGGLSGGPTGQHPNFGGGSEGTGVFPFIRQTPSNRYFIKSYNCLTPGMVINADGDPICRALVLITHPAIGIVAQTYTDDNGFFVLNLPEIPNLVLSLPLVPVTGVEIAAGVSILIAVP